MGIRLTTFLLLIFTLISMAGHAQVARNASWYIPFYVAPNEIQLSIIFEGKVNTADGEENGFSISWTDTIGVKQGFPAQNRPYELKVVVRDKERIVGKYTGLSTQMTHCYFATNAKKVSVHFWLDVNPFYVREQLDLGDVFPDSLAAEIVASPLIIEGFFGVWKEREEYAPLKIDLRKVDRNIVDGYYEKKVM